MATKRKRRAKKKTTAKNPRKRRRPAKRRSTTRAKNPRRKRTAKRRAAPRAKNPRRRRRRTSTTSSRRRRSNPPRSRRRRSPARRSNPPMSRRRRRRNPVSVRSAFSRAKSGLAQLLKPSTWIDVGQSALGVSAALAGPGLIVRATGRPDLGYGGWGVLLSGISSALGYGVASLVGSRALAMRVLQGGLLTTGLRGLLLVLPPEYSRTLLPVEELRPMGMPSPRPTSAPSSAARGAAGMSCYPRGAGYLPGAARALSVDQVGAGEARARAGLGYLVPASAAQGGCAMPMPGLAPQGAAPQVAGAWQIQAENFG